MYISLKILKKLKLVEMPKKVRFVLGISQAAYKYSKQ